MWFDENFMLKYFIKIINESVSDLGATVFNFINNNGENL